MKKKNNELPMKDRVWISVKHDHNLELKDSILKTIDQVYKDYKVLMLKDLILFRFVNIIIAFIVFLVGLILIHFNIHRCFFVIIFGLFFLSNIVSLIQYIVKYKKFKNNE